MSKAGNDVPQYYGAAETTTRETTPPTFVIRVSSKDDVNVNMIDSRKFKNQQNLQRDSILETDQPKFTIEKVSEKNRPVNTREVKSPHKTNDETRSFIIKLTKSSEVGKESREINDSSEPVPKEHLPRGQVCDENRYKTPLDFKHSKILRDILLEKNPNRIYSEKVPFSLQNTGLVDESKVQPQISFKNKSHLSGVQSRAFKDVKEDDETDKFPSEPKDLPNDKNCGKQNLTCIITKKLCPLDKSSYSGPFIVTLGNPEPGQKPLELTFECFHTRTTDVSEPVFAPKTKTSSVDSNQIGLSSNVTETKYSKQIYSFTLEEQCLEESNADDQNSSYELKHKPFQKESTSKLVETASEKSKSASKPNIFSTISQTEQKEGSFLSNPQNGVSPVSSIAKQVEPVPRNDHSYVRSFRKKDNSEAKRYHTANRSPTFPISKVSSPNLWSQGEDGNMYDEDINLPFSSTEVNSSNSELLVEEEQNHNEDFWGFFTLMNIGASLPYLPVKEAKSIEKDNLHLPPRDLSEETFSGNYNKRLNDTIYNKWASLRLLSEVAAAPEPLPVPSN